MANYTINDPRLPDRFWSKVDTSGDCWNWTACKYRKGYGLYWHDSRNMGAHRVAYQALVGPLEHGLEIDHLCRNRACVNPAHLEQVTRQVNILRGVSPAASNAQKLTCPKGHTLGGENLVPSQRSRGKRSCSLCKREGSASRNLVLVAAANVVGIPIRKYREQYGYSVRIAESLIARAE